MMLWLSLLSCSENKTDETCRLHTDCASGLCGEDGFCSESADATVDDSADIADTTDTESDTEEDSTLCTPNHDGTITREEYPLAIETAVNFMLGREAEVDLTGERWDFSGAMNQDVVVVVTPKPPSEFWFAENAADSTYVTVLSYDTELYGAFSMKNSGLYLDGIASFEEGLFSTQLGFDPPVPMLQFPLKEGDSWETETIISGFVNGSWTVYSETYSSEVDKAGTVVTPMGEFPVLRLNTGIDRWAGLLNTKNRSMAFIAECYGTVATVASTLDETEEEFTEAEQILRIAP